MPLLTNEQYARLILAGTVCSNCCYNLSQRPGETVSERDAESMKASCEAWDAALRNAPRYPSKRKKVRNERTNNSPAFGVASSPNRE